MEDPTGAETSEASDARKEEPCRIMTINMECKGKMLADEEKKLIISTIEGSSASLIFCQKAVGNFKTKVVEKCVKDGSSYQFVPKDIRNRKGKDKVAVMWCETDFEGKEVEDKESSSAMAKLTSKGTTKASFLAVSWHGPEKVDEESKAFHRLICFVREVCENEKLSWFIIGGYFNFDTSKVNLTELKGLETISRGRSFVLCKVTFAEDIIVSDVKHLELENESRINPQLKHVPVMGVLKLVQDRDLPRQMLVNLQLMQRDVSKVSSNTNLLTELEKIASDKGFVISDNEGSGNCMFYALSEQLSFVKRTKISHGELRQSIVKYLRNNPKLSDGQDLFDFINGYQSWADYLSDMEQDGTWGDHVILHGTANCYKTYIDVISSQSNHRDLTIRPDGQVISTNPLVLGHVHEIHYVSLLPKQDTSFTEDTTSKSYTSDKPTNEVTQGLTPEATAGAAELGSRASCAQRELKFGDASTPFSSQSPPSAIPECYVTREDFERLFSLVELIDAKVNTLTAEVEKIKLAIKPLDGPQGNDSQAQSTEPHSQTIEVSESPVLKQDSDRESTSEKKKEENKVNK